MLNRYSSLLDISDKESFNIFFYEEYIKALNNNVEFYYLCSDSRAIPIQIKKKIFFRYAEFLSEPLIYSTRMQVPQETEKEFLDQVCEYLKNKERIHWINQSGSATLFSAYPQNAIYIPFGSHIIDLSLNEDELMANMHSKHRNVIKKAIKDGVVIKQGGEALIDEYCRIEKDAWVRSSFLGYSKSHYKAILNSLPRNSRVYISYLNNEPQSGAIILYNRTMAYYMYGSSIKGAHNGAGNLLQWEIIKDMMSEGVLKYSFVGCRIAVDEGSKYYNIQRFKERFGGTLFQGYLFRVIYNKTYFYLYRFLVSLISSIRTKKITRHKDIIDQEIHKWKK